MARFILSGEVGAGSLVRMARAAHQCLAKPCRGDVLVDVLRRAVLEPGAVREPALLTGLYGLRSLPVPAPRFAAVRRLLGAPPSDARDREAVTLLAGTVGLGHQLQVATWTRLGVGAPPLHVHDAYFQLGPDAVCSLLDSDLLKPVPGGETTPFQHGTWRRSELAATTSQAHRLRRRPRHRRGPGRSRSSRCGAPPRRCCPTSACASGSRRCARRPPPRAAPARRSNASVSG